MSTATAGSTRNLLPRRGAACRAAGKRGGGAPAGLVHKVPVEDGGVVLVDAAVDGVLAVHKDVQVVLVHLAALGVQVEVVLGQRCRGPVDVAVHGQPVVLQK